MSVAQAIDVETVKGHAISGVTKGQPVARMSAVTCGTQGKPGCRLLGPRFARTEEAHPGYVAAAKVVGIDASQATACCGVFRPLISQ
jgi:hypothetical protein